MFRIQSAHLHLTFRYPNLLWSGNRCNRGVGLDSPTEPLVGGEELGAHLLGKRHACRVVRREVCSQLEYAGEQGQVAVSAQRKIEVIAERFGRAPLGEDPPQHCPSEPRYHFHVAERRNVQIDVGESEGVPHRAGPIRTEQVFEQRGGVGDDEPQEASRPARSSRMSSAARRLSLTGFLASIRSKTSTAGGLDTSRSSSSWM